MTTITHDIEFKKALAALSVADQRRLGALFVKNVLALADDERVRRAVALVQDGNASPEELQAAAKNAKAASLDFHTRCGYEGDWKDQAAYFVAKAAAACVAPEGAAKKPGGIAWEAAMSCRMARTCAVIDSGEADSHDESERQYEILAGFQQG